MTQAIAAVAFDLFGTLVTIDKSQNPFSTLLRAVRQTHDLEKIKNLAKEALTRDFGDVDGFRNFLVENGIPVTKADEIAGQTRHQIQTAQLFPEAIEVLERLRSGNIRTAIVSNLGSPFGVVVQNLGLEKLVDAIIFSYKAGCRKPDPQIYQAAARSLNIPLGSVLMIGDTPVADFHGAIRAGAQAVLLDRTAAQPNIPTMVNDLRGILTFFNI